MTTFLESDVGFVLKGCSQHDGLIAETWILKGKEAYLNFTAAENESRINNIVDVPNSCMSYAIPLFPPLLLFPLFVYNFYHYCTFWEIY